MSLLLVGLWHLTLRPVLGSRQHGSARETPLIPPGTDPMVGEMESLACATQLGQFPYWAGWPMHHG
jgi:hypothetical protein